MVGPQGLEPRTNGYEAVQLGAFRFCKLKNSKRFFLAEPPRLTETEPLPNLPETYRPTELRK